MTAVIEDKKRGLVAKLTRSGAVNDAQISAVLGQFAQGWEWEAAQ